MDMKHARVNVACGFGGSLFQRSCLRVSMAAIALLTLAAGGGVALAGPGKPVGAAGKAQPKTERQREDEQVFSRLAKAWTATLAGDHSQAITLAQPITKLSDPRYRWAAVEAVHVQARAYHQSGSARGRSRASQMWKKVRKLSKDSATVSRIEIAKALSLEAASAPAGSTHSAGSGQAGLTASDQAKLTAAIGTLEPLLRVKKWNLATVEAALDLSRLYTQARRFDDAKKALDYVVAYLGNARNIRAMELPPALAAPFINAAKAALKNLKYDRNAGLAEFQAAEKLRHDKKFAQAAQAYQALIKNFPQSDYAPRSDLHIGDCLLGLGQTARAIAHWEKFIAPAPAGPWRGQAYISIIDYYLEEQLDLTNASKYATQARTSLPAALADKPTPAAPANGAAPRITAAESWQLVAFDIHLRVGLVSFCQGQGQSAIAAKAFQSAKALTKNKETAKSLTTLIAATKAGQPVIPTDVTGGGAGEMKAAGAASPSAKSEIRNPKSAISLALSLGTINLLIHRIDQADAFFDRVLGTPAVPAKRGVPARRARPPMPGATPAQRAYAIFGRGATLQASNKPDQAKEYFQASIQAHKQATWHDETLYRLATIAQKRASSCSLGASKEERKDAKPGSADKARQSAATAAVEKSRLSARLSANAEALRCSQELINRYPKSIHYEETWYMASILQMERTNRKEGLVLLDQFTRNYPRGQFTGEALLILGQTVLERDMDIERSRAYLNTLDAWIQGKRGTKKEVRTGVGILSQIGTPHRPLMSVPEGISLLALSGPEELGRRWYYPAQLKACACTDKYLASIKTQCAVLMGFIHYAEGNTHGALAEASRIASLDPAARNLSWSSASRVKWAIEHKQLLAYPDELSLFKRRAKLGVQLGDYYYLTEQFDRAISVFTRLIEGEFGKMNEAQTEYLVYARAKAMLQKDGRAGQTAIAAILSELETIVRKKTGSTTEIRSALTIATLCRFRPFEGSEERRRELLEWAAQSRQVNLHAYKARIYLALDYVREGKGKAGIDLLRSIPKEAGSAYGQAQMIMNDVSDPQSRLSLSLSEQGERIYRPHARTDGIQDDNK